VLTTGNSYQNGGLTSSQHGDANNRQQNFSRYTYLPDCLTVDNAAMLKYLTLAGLSLAICMHAKLNGRLSVKEFGCTVIPILFATLIAVLHTNYKEASAEDESDDGNDDDIPVLTPQHHQTPPAAQVSAPAIERLIECRHWTTTELPARISTIGTTALQAIRSNLPNRPSFEIAALTPYLAAIALAFIAETLEGGKYPITTLWGCGTLYGLKPNLLEKFTLMTDALMTDALRYNPFANPQMQGAPNDQVLPAPSLVGTAQPITNNSNIPNFGPDIKNLIFLMMFMATFAVYGLGANNHSLSSLLTMALSTAGNVGVTRAAAALSLPEKLRRIKDWTNELPARISTIGTTALQAIRSTLPNQPSLERAAPAVFAAALTLAVISGNYTIEELMRLNPTLPSLLAMALSTAGSVGVTRAAAALSFPEKLRQLQEWTTELPARISAIGTNALQAIRSTLPNQPLAGRAQPITDPSAMQNVITAMFIAIMVTSVLNTFLGSEIHNPLPLALIGGAFAIGSGVKKAKDAVSFVQGMIQLAGVGEDAPAFPKVPFVYNFTMASAIMGAIGLFTLYAPFTYMICAHNEIPALIPLFLNIVVGAALGPAVKSLFDQKKAQMIQDVKHTVNGYIADAVVRAIDQVLALLPSDVDPDTLQGRVRTKLLQARSVTTAHSDDLFKGSIPLTASVRGILTDNLASAKAIVLDAAKATKNSALSWLGNNAAQFTIQSIAVPFLQKLWKLQKTAAEKAFIQDKLNLITKHRLETEPQQLLMAILQLPPGCLIEGVEIPSTLQAVFQAFTSNDNIKLTKKNPAEACEEDKPIYDQMVDTTINPRAQELMNWLSQGQEFDYAARSKFTKTPDGDITTKQQIEKEVAITTEILTLKGIYKLFESSGGKAEPFEAILELMITADGKLTGDIKKSSQSFLKKLRESMDVVGKTNPLIRGFIGTILLPAITNTVVEMGQNGTKKFFEKAKVQIGEQLSSDANNRGGNNELLDSFSALFNKVSNAIDAHVAGGALSSTSLVTREEFINNKVKGDPKETEKSYRNLTHTFVNTFCPTPLNAAGKLAKTRSELMDKLTGPELSGAKKILMTPLYAVAIAVMWIVEYVFVRWAEWCINKIVTAFIKKSADDAKIMESLVTTAVDAIKGKNNGGRGTEIMDTLIEEVLILANQAISEELKDGSAASVTKLSPEDNKASKEFIRSFIEAVNKYSTTNEDTLEARIKKMLSPLTSMGIGITFDKILDLLAPHIHKLYKEITTEEKLDELTVLGLKALNTTLQRTDDVTKVTKTQLEERKQEEQTRKIKIANQIEVLSKQLFELAKKDIKTEVVELSDNVQSTIVDKFNEFSKQSLLAIKAINEDHTSVECKIGIVDRSIQNLVEFKEFISSTASKQSISQDLKTIIGNAYHTLSELITLFRDTEIRLHASIITEQEKYLIQKIKNLSSNQGSLLNESINAILEEYKNLTKEKRPISEVQIMRQLATINEVIELKGRYKEEEGYYTAALSLLNQTHSNTLREELRKSYMELVHNKKPKNMSQNVWNELTKLIRSPNDEGFSVRKQNMLNHLTIKRDDACNQSDKCSAKINTLIEDVKKITQDYEKCFITTGKADLPRIIQETESLFGKLTAIFNTQVKPKLNLRLGMTEASVGLLGLFEPFLLKELGKYLHQATAALPFLTSHAIGTVGLETLRNIFAGNTK